MLGVAPCEAQLARRDVARGHLFDVAALHCVAERVAVDRLALDGLLVGAEGRRREAEHARAGEAREHVLPAGGSVVVALVDEDEVEEVGGKVLEPASVALAELLDVRDHDVGALGVVDIRVGVEHRPEWSLAEVGQHSSAAIEAAWICRVHRGGDLVADGQVRRDDQHSPSRDAERQNRDEAGLAAADWDLFDRSMPAVCEVLNGGGVAFDLRVTERRVALHTGVHRLEEPPDVVVRESHDRHRTGQGGGPPAVCRADKRGR